MRLRRPTGSARLAAFSSRGKDSPNPHALKIGPDTITGLMLQWQDGKQVNLWPANVANGKLKFPKFVKLGAAN
jgi:branched-chain amino acid transport system substrate-binding protein